jgi:hypothetical protein
VGLVVLAVVIADAVVVGSPGVLVVVGGVGS